MPYFSVKHKLIAGERPPNDWTDLLKPLKVLEKFSFYLALVECTTEEIKAVIDKHSDVLSLESNLTLELFMHNTIPKTNELPVTQRQVEKMQPYPQVKKRRRRK